MEDKTDIQLQIFRRIRDQLPGHVSLVDEVAEILGISNDSAYRRIRGEKQLSIQEVVKLAGIFKFSLDDVTDHRSDTVTFRANFLESGSYTFREWLESLLFITRETSKAGDAEVLFILNELNIFHLIQFPALCAFKLFFWQKSNLDFPEYREIIYRHEQQDTIIAALSEEITDLFVGVNTIELTTEECLNSILKQLVFYYEAGYFASRDDLLALCEELHRLVSHQKKQAELGYKFPYGRTPSGREGNFRLYYNDIILADNTIIIKAGEKKVTFITGNAINLMFTHNPAFFEYNERWGRNLLAKSVLISGTAEKERNRFFLKLRQQIDRVAGSV